MRPNFQRVNGSIIGFCQFPATKPPEDLHPSGLNKQQRRLLSLAAIKKVPLRRHKSAASSFDKLFSLGLIDKIGKITERGLKVYNTIK